MIGLFYGIFSCNEQGFDSRHAIGGGEAGGGVIKGTVSREKYGILSYEVLL